MGVSMFPYFLWNMPNFIVFYFFYNWNVLKVFRRKAFCLLSSINNLPLLMSSLCLWGSTSTLPSPKVGKFHNSSGNRKEGRRGVLWCGVHHYRRGRVRSGFGWSAPEPGMQPGQSCAVGTEKGLFLAFLAPFPTWYLVGTCAFFCARSNEGLTGWIFLGRDPLFRSPVVGGQPPSAGKVPLGPPFLDGSGGAEPEEGGGGTV